MHLPRGYCFAWFLFLFAGFVSRKMRIGLADSSEHERIRYYQLKPNPAPIAPALYILFIYTISQGFSFLTIRNALL